MAAAKKKKLHSVHNFAATGSFSTDFLHFFFITLQLNSNWLTQWLPSPNLTFGVYGIVLWHCRSEREREIRRSER